jgi:hypothetical protein
MRRTIWVGVIIVTAGILVYLARHPFRIVSKWMMVSTVDAGGNPVGKSQWVRIPDPDVVAHDGMSRVEPYVTRLMASRARFNWLSIFTPDGQRGFGVYYEHSQASLALNVDWRSEPKKEHDIRRMFAGLGIAPTEDYLAGNGGVPDATRILTYPVPGDASKVAALCCRVLREIYGVTDTGRLDFTYTEHT